jgi:hypothetical protein
MLAVASDGTYKGYWMLESDKGTVFGLGANGNVPDYVLIVVR